MVCFKNSFPCFNQWIGIDYDIGGPCPKVLSCVRHFSSYAPFPLVLHLWDENIILFRTKKIVNLHLKTLIIVRASMIKILFPTL